MKFGVAEGHRLGLISGRFTREIGDARHCPSSGADGRGPSLGSYRHCAGAGAAAGRPLALRTTVAAVARALHQASAASAPGAGAARRSRGAVGRTIGAAGCPRGRAARFGRSAAARATKRAARPGGRRRSAPSSPILPFAKAPMRTTSPRSKPSTRQGLTVRYGCTEMGFSAKGQAAIFEIEKADDWGLDANCLRAASAAAAAKAPRSRP